MKFLFFLIPFFLSIYLESLTGIVITFTFFILSIIVQNDKGKKFDKPEL